MKKAFILSLVLGIMSLASAATEIVPSLEYEVSGNTLTLIATSPVIGYLLNLKADDGSLLSDSTLNPHFGVASYNYPGQWNNTGYLPNGLLGVSASVGLNPYLTGTIYSVDFASTAQSIQFVYAQYSASSMHFGSGFVDLTGKTMTVPEPATMALLGLGGLFLGRRRK